MATGKVLITSKQCTDPAMDAEICSAGLEIQRRDMSRATRLESRDAAPAWGSGLGLRSQSHDVFALTLCAYSQREVRLRLRHAVAHSPSSLTPSTVAGARAHHRTVTAALCRTAHSRSLPADEESRNVCPPVPASDFIILHIPPSSPLFTITSTSLIAGRTPFDDAVHPLIAPTPPSGSARLSTRPLPAPPFPTFPVRAPPNTSQSLQPSTPLLLHIFETLARCCAQPPTSKPPHSGYGPPCKSSRTLRCACSMPTYRPMSTT